MSLESTAPHDSRALKGHPDVVEKSSNAVHPRNDLNLTSLTRENVGGQSESGSIGEKVNRTLSNLRSVLSDMRGGTDLTDSFSIHDGSAKAVNSRSAASEGAAVNLAGNESPKKSAGKEAGTAQPESAVASPEAGDSKTKKKLQSGPQQFVHDEAAASAAEAGRAKDASATPEQTKRATESGAMTLARAATPALAADTKHSEASPIPVPAPGVAHVAELGGPKHLEAPAPAPASGAGRVAEQGGPKHLEAPAAAPAPAPGAARVAEQGGPKHLEAPAPAPAPGAARVTEQGGPKHVEAPAPAPAPGAARVAEQGGPKHLEAPAPAPAPGAARVAEQGGPKHLEAPAAAPAPAPGAAHVAEQGGPKHLEAPAPAPAPGTARVAEQGGPKHLEAPAPAPAPGAARVAEQGGPKHLEAPAPAPTRTLEPGPAKANENNVARIEPPTLSHQPGQLHNAAIEPPSQVRGALTPAAPLEQKHIASGEPQSLSRASYAPAAELKHNAGLETQGPNRAPLTQNAGIEAARNAAEPQGLNHSSPTHIAAVEPTRNAAESQGLNHSGPTHIAAGELARNAAESQALNHGISIPSAAAEHARASTTETFGINHGAATHLAAGELQGLNHGAPSYAGGTEVKELGHGGATHVAAGELQALNHGAPSQVGGADVKELGRGATHVAAGELQAFNHGAPSQVGGAEIKDLGRGAAIHVAAGELQALNHGAPSQVGGADVKELGRGAATHIAAGEPQALNHGVPTHVAANEFQGFNHLNTLGRSSDSAEPHSASRTPIAELQALNHAGAARAAETAIENHAVALGRKDEPTNQFNSAAAGLEGRRNNFEGIRPMQTAGLNSAQGNPLAPEGFKNDLRLPANETLSRSQTTDTAGSTKWESALNQLRQEKEVANVKGERVNATQIAMNEKVVQNSRLEAAQVQSIEKGQINKIEAPLVNPARETNIRVENTVPTAQVKDSTVNTRTEFVPVQIPTRRESQDSSKSDTNETKLSASNQSTSGGGSSSSSSQNQTQGSTNNGFTNQSVATYGQTQSQDPSTNSNGSKQWQDPSTNPNGSNQSQDPSTNSNGSKQSQDPSTNLNGSLQAQDPSSISFNATQSQDPTANNSTNNSNSVTSQEPSTNSYGSTQTQTQDPTSSNYTQAPDPSTNSDPNSASQQATAPNNTLVSDYSGQLFPWTIGYDPMQTSTAAGTYNNDTTFTPSIAPIDPTSVQIPLGNDPGVPSLQNPDDSYNDFSVQPAISLSTFAPEIENEATKTTHAYAHHVHTSALDEPYNAPIEALIADRKEIVEQVDTTYIPYSSDYDQEQVSTDRRESAIQLENDYRAEKAAREEAEKAERRNEEVRRLTDASLSAMSTKQHQQLEADRLALLARRQQQQLDADRQAQAARRQQQLDAEKMAQMVKRQQQIAEETKQDSYVVKKNDTLESIAEKKLGSAKLSNLIYDLNKGRIPTKMSEDGSLIHTLNVGTVLLLPSRVQVRAYTQRQLLETARANHSTLPSHDSKIDSDRRSNIEKYLGPITAAPAGDNLIYIVRLGDSLRSIAMKHPALRDVNLWKLIAKINDLPTTTDSHGAPTTALVRGTTIKVPNQNQIAKYRLTVTGNNLALLQPKNSEGKNELASLLCRSCNRLLTPSCTICPGCASPISNRSPEMEGSENGDTTLSMKNPSPILPTPFIVEEAIIASKAYKLSESCRITRTKIGRVDHELVRLELEIISEAGWTTILSYEMSPENTVRHEFFPNARKRSIEIELPIFAAQEMIQNDLSANWQSYVSNYELMQRLPA
ncbi:MAG TPA: LysM peptidoglycan-binding domain-containing protein [Drouetiella sp.]